MKLTQPEIDEKKDIELIVAHLPKESGLKVLDLGCGDCAYLYKLYQKIPDNISKMIGIDLGEDEDGEEIVFNNDFYDNYNSNFHGRVIPDGIGTFIPMDAELYIKNSEEKFDLIIVSNFVHLFPWEHSRQLLIRAIDLLSDRGIIFLKVANESHTFNDREDRFPFDSNKLEDLKSIANIVVQIRKEKHYNLILQPLY